MDSVWRKTVSLPQFETLQGDVKTKLYLEENWWAIRKYEELSRQIDCDFEEKTAYVYSLDNPGKLEREAMLYGILGLDDKIVDTPELPFATVGALRMTNQAQFHPLKFLSAIVRDLKIYEHSFVKELLPNKAVTEQGSVTYQQVIFATHYPIDNKHGFYFLKLYQHRSYVIALEHAAQLPALGLRPKMECSAVHMCTARFASLAIYDKIAMYVRK